MEKILLLIKHHIAFLWRIIERINSVIFNLVYKSRLDQLLPVIFSEFPDKHYTYRQLGEADIESLYDLIRGQDTNDLKYFNPHGFDLSSLRKQLSNSSFLMMGAFDGETMAGYFFLRFFLNRKCFVGRLIDKNYRGKGIGLVMNKIMYETAWRMNFHCLSTISRNNALVMRAHSKNPSMVVLKDLPNDYLLVEFIRKTTN